MTIVTMGRQGRIVVPVDIRHELNLEEGVQLDLRVHDGRIELTRRMTPEEAARSLRGIFKDPEGRSVVDELIAERRAEAAAG